MLGPLSPSLINGTSLPAYCAANGREPNMIVCCSPNPVNSYNQYGPCATWCDILKGKFILPHGQDVLSAGDGEELDQLFGQCLSNGTGSERTGTTICEMQSGAPRSRFDGAKSLRWVLLGMLVAHYYGGC